MSLRRAVLAAVGALVLAGPVAGAVLIGVRVDLQFIGCGPTDGFYQTLTDGNPSPLEPVSWGDGQGITWRSDGPPMSSHFVLRLLAADGSTMLFERAFERTTGPDGPTQYWLLQTTVDCETEPYREVLVHATAELTDMTPMVLLAAGTIAIVLGLLVFVRWRGIGG